MRKRSLGDVAVETVGIRVFQVRGIAECLREDGVHPASDPFRHRDVDPCGPTVEVVVDVRLKDRVVAVPDALPDQATEFVIGVMHRSEGVRAVEHAGTAEDPAPGIAGVEGGEAVFPDGRSLSPPVRLVKKRSRLEPLVGFFVVLRS